MSLKQILPALRPSRPSLPSLRSTGPEEDLFVEMTLSEHLNELRSRLVKTVAGILLAFIVGLILAPKLLELVRVAANVERFDVITAVEPITNYFTTALYIAVAIAFPLIFYQMFAFIAPGLTRKEKRILYGSLPFVVFFFMLGASFAFFFAIPRAFEFLSTFQEDLFDYSPTYGSIASFYIRVSLGLGIAFQLPILMYLMGRLSMVSSKRLSSSRRYAMVIVLIAAAIITPTPDPFNMLFIAVPIYGMYELGLIFARLGERRARKKPTGPDPELSTAG
ncbi:twin-arginine translocase subunit TatC [soil metagenome]